MELRRLSKQIKALFTLSSGEGTIFISKGESYDLYYEEDKRFIIDNTGEKHYLSYSDLTQRFE
jgi:hypothetical protein